MEPTNIATHIATKEEKLVRRMLLTNTHFTPRSLYNYKIVRRGADAGICVKYRTIFCVDYMHGLCSVCCMVKSLAP